MADLLLSLKAVSKAKPGMGRPKAPALAVDSLTDLEEFLKAAGNP